jgi:hypothetical protein
MVTACLAFSLGMSALYPALAVGPQGAQPPADSPRKCCCGTPDARCCGTACCMSRLPPKPAEPASPGGRNPQRVDTLVLVLDTTANFELAGGDAARLARPLSEATGSPADSTLQALQVRLNT